MRCQVSSTKLFQIHVIYNLEVIFQILGNKCCDSICTLDEECHFDEVCKSGKCTRNRNVVWTCKAGTFEDLNSACKMREIECSIDSDCKQNYVCKVGFCVTEEIIFNAFRNSSISSPGTITYSGTNVNLGNGLNLEDGIFTAPKDGFYFFQFQALCDDGNANYINIIHNGDIASRVYRSHRAVSYNSF